MVKGELLTLGAAATAVGGAYKVGEFLFKAKRVRDVGPSNAVYVRIIGRVRSDLDEVRRLLSVREVHDALEANPEKSRWVYGAMRDVRGALENITPHTERVSGDVEAGRRIGVRHRVYWLLSEKEKLENREKELNFAHASLSEVLGYLTALEPVEEPKKPKEKEELKKETHIDIDIHRDAPPPPPPPPQHHHAHGPQHTHERVEREVYIERDAAPRRVERVEERDVYFERDRQGPPRYEQHADIHIDEHGPHHQHVEADIHVQRGRDPRHLDHPQRYEAQYDDRYEQHDQYRSEYPEERHHETRPFPEPLGRRPEAYEDRLPERDSWMQSDARRARAQGQGQGNYGPYGEYAEYGAPQPVGAAHYQLPLSKEYKEREMWIEQKEDYRFDQYGNRLPDRFFQPPVPRPYRSRM